MKGIFGGVFDPPHNGHVALARAALHGLDLDSLLVLVVADPGHKRATTPAATRLELARLAFGDVPGAEVELDDHARTVDSLESRALDDAIFVIGADEFVDFPTWKRPERILDLVGLAVAMRPGVDDAPVQEVLEALAARDRVTFFELAPVPVSSTDVRARVRRGEAIDGLVPGSVADAIRRLGLYSDAEYTAAERERKQTD